jgi:phosphoribosyl-ATP pyrophosphohydrolase
MAKTTKRKAASKGGVKNKIVKGGVKNKAVKAGVSNKTVGKLRRAMRVPMPAWSGATAGARSGAEVIDRLWSVVTTRRDADPAISHSARLLSRGPAKVAQKFGEEAVECLIEAVRGDRDALIAESADVIYHLIVLWVSTGVAPDEVWAELMRREGVSGIAEKASRAQTSLVARVLKTTKIP